MDIVNDNKVPDIEELKNLGDIEGLINALGYREDRHVRWKAANVLVGFGDKSENQLIKALKSENKHIRGYSVEILGRLNSKKAVKPLIKLLKEEKFPDVREAAASALGRIGGYKAMGALTDALEDEDLQVKREAEKALKKLGYF